MNINAAIVEKKSKRENIIIEETDFCNHYISPSFVQSVFKSMEQNSWREKRYIHKITNCGSWIVTLNITKNNPLKRNRGM